MGLFWRRWRIVQAPGTQEETAVAGVSFHQADLRHIGEGSHDRFHPMPEPRNPHSSTAVVIRANGIVIGHLPEEVSGEYFGRLSELARLHVTIRTSGYVGTWKKGHFARLFLPPQSWLDELIAANA